MSGRFYSQVVVKLDTPVQHDVLEDLQAGTIKLLLSPVQSIEEIGEIQVFPYDRFVENITSALIGEKVELTIFLKNPSVRSGIETRDWPFELVLDIRPFDIETPDVVKTEGPPAEVSVADPVSNSAARRRGPPSRAQPLAIRTGYHESYSRIVVEFDRRVDHEVRRDEENRALVIDLRPVNSFTPLMPIRIHPEDRYLNKLDYQVGDSTLKIIASLQNPDVQVNSYEFDSPFRIIVDIRPLISPSEETSKTEKRPTSVESTPARLENPPDSILSAILRGEDDAVDTAMLDSTDMATDSLGFKVGPNLSAFTLDLGSNSLVRPLRTKPAPRSAAGNKMQTFIQVVVGFIIFDILLAGIYFRRRRKSKKRRTSDSNFPTKELAKSVARDPEFMDVLATTLREGGAISESSPPTASARPSGAKVTVKIGDMIDSLSTALGRITSIGESDVAIDPSRHDLRSMSESSGLTVEDIIGRDGQEFVKNLTRMQNK